MKFLKILLSGALVFLFFVLLFFGWSAYIVVKDHSKFKEKQKACIAKGALPYSVNLAEPILAKKLFKYRKSDWTALGFTQKDIENSLVITVLEPLENHFNDEPDIIYGDSARKIEFNLDICPRQKEELKGTINCARDPGFGDHGLHFALSPCLDASSEGIVNRLNYFFE